MLGLLVLTGLVAFAVRAVDFSILAVVGPLDVALLALPVVAFHLSRAYAIQALLPAVGVELGAREWIGLHVYTSLANLALPLRTGLGLKALYLKASHGLRLTSFAALQGVLFLAGLGTSLAAALATGLLTAAGDRGLLGLLGLGLVLLALPLLAPRMVGRRGPAVLRPLFEIYRSFHELKSESRRVASAVGVSLLAFASMALALFLALRVLGARGSLFEAAVIALVIVLSNQILITPGNLGVQEFAAGLVGSSLALDFDRALVAMLLVRVVSVGLLVAAAPFFAALGGKVLRLSRTAPD